MNKIKVISGFAILFILFGGLFYHLGLVSNLLGLLALGIESAIVAITFLAIHLIFSGKEPKRGGETK